MPFDASGNFTRVYNFQQDAANGIKILAARVDGEFDNIATGMNAVFFRDGRVPMQADLRMNINGITGLKDGALGSPAIKFNTDAGTGVYLPGLNQYGIQVNSVQRGVFTTAGFDVTGNFTASGTGAFTGNLSTSANFTASGTGAFTGNLSTSGTLSEGGTLLSAKYLPQSNPTFTGSLTGPIHAVSGATGSFILAPRDATTGNSTLYSNTANSLRLSQNSTDTAIFTSTGHTFNQPLTVNGTLNWTGGTSQGSNAGGAVSHYLNAAAGAVRTFGFLAGGVYAADIALQADNATIRHNCTTAHQFMLNGTEMFKVQGTTASVYGGKLIMQHDGSNGYIRADTGVLNLGAGGVNTVQFNSSGQVSLSGSGAYVQNTSGGGGAWNVGYSHSRTGIVGYHMYNGGATCEWIMYQPAGATSNNFCIATGVSGTLTNRMQIDPSGNMTVSGNITSSSDARLKTNVRDFENATALIGKLRPRRYIKDFREDFGLVAQEVQPYFPEIIQTTGPEGMLSVDYGRLVAPLIAAVNALSARLEAAGL